MIIKFPYRHTGNPRIINYMDDGTVIVALQFTEKVNNRNLKRYKVAYFDYSNNPHVRQALSTKHYIGQEDLINGGIVSAEAFEKARKCTMKRI